MTVPLDRQKNTADVAARVREQLGLGSASVEDTTAFATSAQGAKADSAIQAADLTAFARTLLDDADGAAVWATLGGTSWGDHLNGGIKLPDGTIIQWGFVSSPDVDGYTYVPFSQTFPNQIFGFYPQAAGPWVSLNNVFVAYQDWGNTHVSGGNVYVRQVNGGSVSPAQVNVRWFAIGR